MSRVPEAARVGTGVSVWVMDGPYVLMGLRKGAHGAGTWAPPGGHLEWGEGFEEAASREAEEEAGLRLYDLQVLGVTNDLFQPESASQRQRHYVTVHLAARSLGRHTELREPDKCERWEWVPLDGLPGRPLFLPVANLLASPARDALAAYAFQEYFR